MPRRRPHFGSYLALAVLISAWGFAALGRADGSPTPLASVPSSSTSPVMVFAAISMSEALQNIATQFTRQTGIEVKYVFASSAQLARQIEAGARADVFISADQQWMDELRRARHIDPWSERRIAGNRLVVIQPANLPKVEARNWMRTLGRGRLATGDPDFVPLGRYAREALTSLGVWTTLRPHLARAENARSATLLVARGEAPLGIVYATDALIEPRVKVITTLESSLHLPIVYPAARLKDAEEGSMAYLDFLSSTEGQKIFARHGFERGD
ncbi:MAG: molybdate ABC transporter substrate-binding protein [Gammaproteobacteria bacterium]|nr:molybdate ABC transporter substrate-binding protein [Gammaproteobacteria bacterium]